MPISNPEVEAGDETDYIIGYKKRRVSLKQRLAGVFQRIQSSRSYVDCKTSLLDVNQDASLPGLTGAWGTAAQP